MRALLLATITIITLLPLSALANLPYPPEHYCYDRVEGATCSAGPDSVGECRWIACSLSNRCDEAEGEEVQRKGDQILSCDGARDEGGCSLSGAASVTGAALILALLLVTRLRPLKRTNA